MTKENEEKLKTIKETTVELLGLLKIDQPEVAIEEDEEGTVRVNIQTPDSALLIGYHGQTLSSFQLILSLIAYKKLGVWQKVIVDIGDYRERREEEITQMALNLARQVKESGKATVLPSLSPNERRIVHLCLQEDPTVETYSEGEGRYRRLVIAPAGATPTPVPTQGRDDAGFQPESFIAQEPPSVAKEPEIAG